MLDFQLFRVKVYIPSQINFFIMNKSPTEILKEIVFSLPSAELKRGMIWNIGNVTPIDETGIYFRIGRMSKSTIEVYQNGNFLDQEFEIAPYTHVLLDINLEVCAIAKKSKLSAKTAGIVNQLARLLNKSDKASYFDVEIEVNEISDPNDFITHLKQAFAISKFWLTFSRPNSFDANSDFEKPLQRLLKEIEGEKGKLELQGDSLKAGSLEDITRSLASTGNDASALLVEEKGRKGVRKYLRGNPVFILEEDIVDDQQKRDFFRRIREVYYKIRGKSNAEL